MGYAEGVKLRRNLGETKKHYTRIRRWISKLSVGLLVGTAVAMHCRAGRNLDGSKTFRANGHRGGARTKVNKNGES